MWAVWQLGLFGCLLLQPHARCAAPGKARFAAQLHAARPMLRGRLYT